VSSWQYSPKKLIKISKPGQLRFLGPAYPTAPKHNWQHFDIKP